MTSSCEAAFLFPSFNFLIPGGFSFGDELGSGKLLALKILHYLGDSLKTASAKAAECSGYAMDFRR